MDKITLFHVGFAVIEHPDVHYGRRNADFGQGFYLSDDEEFSRRWARERSGTKTWLNRYELDPAGLRIRRFARDAAWFDAIYANRTGRADPLSEFDVVVGPIANDTIYDTWGITTSGLLKKEQALRLLLIGPLYWQTAVKSERAAAALRFLSAEEIPPEQIAACRETVRAEEARFQAQFAELLDRLIQ